jgi:hypothetical protein
MDQQFDDALKVAGKKHDVTGIKVYDKMDKNLPDAGMLQVVDAETGQTQWVDSSNAFVRQEYERRFLEATDYCKNVFVKAGCDLLHMRTDDDYVKVLQKFFLART